MHAIPRPWDHWKIAVAAAHGTGHVLGETQANAHRQGYNAPGTPALECKHLAIPPSLDRSVEIQPFSNPILFSTVDWPGVDVDWRTYCIASVGCISHLNAAHRGIHPHMSSKVPTQNLEVCNSATCLRKDATGCCTSRHLCLGKLHKCCSYHVLHLGRLLEPNISSETGKAQG